MLSILGYADRSALILSAALVFVTTMPLSGGELTPLGLPVSVWDHAGGPVSGLTAADFQVFENEIEIPLLSVEESSAESPLQDLFFIVYLGEDLDFRELFRARRALGAWSRSLAGGGQVAVFRSGALSRFSGEETELAQMLNFFGSTGDRFGFDPPEPNLRRPAWFRELAASNAAPDLLKRQLDETLGRGTLGSLDVALGKLKHLSGRKILLYLSRTLPPSDNPAAQDREWLIRSLSDSQVSLFLLNGGRRPSPDALRDIAVRTGGGVVSGNSLGEALDRIATAGRHYYRLWIESRAALDARYRKLVVRSVRQEVTIRQPDGHFATLPDGSDLAGRTFLTALHGAKDFLDLPLEITARLVADFGPPQVEIRLSFPFRSLESEKTTEPVADPGFFQTVRVFAGVFDSRGALLAYLDRGYSVRLKSDQIGQADSTQLAFDGRIPLDQGANPHRVVVVLIAGQNRQIAVKEVKVARPSRLRSESLFYFSGAQARMPAPRPSPTFPEHRQGCLRHVPLLLFRSTGKDACATSLSCFSGAQARMPAPRCVQGPMIKPIRSMSKVRLV